MFAEELAGERPSDQVVVGLAVAAGPGGGHVGAERCQRFREAATNSTSRSSTTSVPAYPMGRLRQISIASAKVNGVSSIISTSWRRCGWRAGDVLAMRLDDDACADYAAAGLGESQCGHSFLPPR